MKKPSIRAKEVEIMFKAKHILVPIDFSPESDLALAWAVKAAKEEVHSSITLCHVLRPIVIPGAQETVEIDYVALYEDQERAIREKLETLRSKIPGTIRLSCIVARGKIAEEIERICEEKSIDLVIMTTHGRRGFSHFLHGSTTEETARRAPCPVLVLHMNSAAKTLARAG
jgi:universal stress protein A